MINEQSKLPPGEMIKLLQKAEPVESSKNAYEDFCCVTCLNLPLDPMICSECNSAVICRPCKDQIINS